MCYSTSEIEHNGDETYTYYGGKLLLQKRNNRWYKRPFHEDIAWTKLPRVSWRQIKKQFLSIEQIAPEDAPLVDLDELVNVLSAHPTKS